MKSTVHGYRLTTRLFDNGPYRDRMSPGRPTDAPDVTDWGEYCDDCGKYQLALVSSLRMRYEEYVDLGLPEKQLHPNDVQRPVQRYRYLHE